MAARPRQSVDIVREVGLRLKDERERSGLSLEQAAMKANLSPEHLREVEEGFPETDNARRRGPTLSKLERVANVYGLRVGLVYDSASA